MNWSDEDPRWEADEESTPAAAESSTAAATVAVSTESVQVGTSEGISVKPNAVPEKLPTLPPIIVSDLRWFESVRDRVPKLRDEWKDLDVPTKMKMRQQALRERITWQIPEKLQPPRVAPTKIQPKKIAPAKHEIPKPK